MMTGGYRGCILRNRGIGYVWAEKALAFAQLSAECRRIRHGCIGDQILKEL
ncbi:MAG: hypothetical protein K6T90_06345 [Leptolyngbyaceae cyanobacterium HOT.MB2.61]|nr:hypothetical protein [Leptolyngbyaceae cyanobacterium HOT.MB2.61]